MRKIIANPSDAPWLEIRLAIMCIQEELELPEVVRNKYVPKGEVYVMEEPPTEVTLEYGWLEAEATDPFRTIFAAARSFTDVSNS